MVSSCGSWFNECGNDKEKSRMRIAKEKRLLHPKTLYSHDALLGLEKIGQRSNSLPFMRSVLWLRKIVWLLRVWGYAKLSFCSFSFGWF